MRNRMAHGYFDIGLAIVWQTVKSSLPSLAARPDHDVLSIESPALARQALQWFVAGPAIFSGYLLAARARIAGCETVLTVDRKAAKTTTHRLLN